MVKILEVNVELATRFGLNESLMIDYFYRRLNDPNSWRQSKHNATWVKCSIFDARSMYPFFTPNNIVRAINSLIKAGVIQKSRLNNTNHDKIYWYSFTPDGLNVLENHKTQSQWEM